MTRPTITVPSLRARSCSRIALVATAILVASSGVTAHRRDALLQAARIAVEPERIEVELDLTPGIAIAQSFVADLDHDRDGVLSTDEQRAYVSRVRSTLELDVDGDALHMTALASTFPLVDGFSGGEGTIRVRYAADLPRLTSGSHAVTFRNRHRPDVGLYLANALVPESDRVEIHAQHRDREQRELTIDYTLRTSGMPAPLWLVTVVASAALLLLVWNPFRLRLWSRPHRLTRTVRTA